MSAKSHQGKSIVGDGYSKRGIFALSIVAIVAASCVKYWKCAGMPFIQDDWAVLYSIVFRGGGGYLAHAFNPSAGGFFRPLAEMYMFGLYQIFGMDPTGYHAVGIAVHALNGCLVFLIFRRIMADPLYAWAVGMMYVCSAPIHLDALYWIVGAYDTLGACFFFLALLQYVSGKPRWSAAMYLCAILSKEATLALPFVLLAYALLVNRGRITSRASDLLAAVRSLKYHFAILVPMAVIQAVYIVPSVAVAGAAAYRSSLDPALMFSNLVIYVRWCMEAVLPLFVSPDIQSALMLGLGVAAAAVLLWKGKAYRGIIGFLICWYILGLLAVLPLEDHAFRYYATYSLPAWLALILLSANFVRDRLGKLGPALMFAFVLFSLYAGARFFVTMNDEWATFPVIDGSNSAPRKAQIVNTISDFFHSSHDPVGDSTVFIIEYFNMGPVGGNAAVCLWYHNPTLRVAETRQLQRDSTGVYFDERLSNVALRYDPDALSPRRYLLDSTKYVIVDYSDADSVGAQQGN
jgi:hypothetical protein